MGQLVLHSQGTVLWNCAGFHLVSPVFNMPMGLLTGLMIGKCSDALTSTQILISITLNPAQYLVLEDN